jgi:uncharacterized protein (TIGR02246 family)
MKHSISFRVGLAFVLAAATFVARAQTDVQVLADQWVAAYNTHDREALGALYTDKAMLMMHGSETIAGRGGIEEFWASDFLDRDPLTLLTVTHSVAGVDLTLVHGDYRVVSRTDGRLLGSGRFAQLWVRDGNRQWRLDRDLWNQPYLPYDETVSSADVQSLANRWVEAYNEHDRAALAAVYMPDARLMMHGAPTFVGRRAIGDFWAADFTEGNPLTLLTVTHAVDGIDMVLVHGNYEVIDRDDGSQLGVGRFAHIWLRDGDTWRLDRDLWQERATPFVY